MTGVRLRSRPVDQRDRDWRPGGRQRRWASGWRIWILLGAVVAVLAAALWAVVWSPLLGVRQISVRGALHYLTRAEVERVAQVPPGRPLVRLDTRSDRASRRRPARSRDGQRRGGLSLDRRDHAHRASRGRLCHKRRRRSPGRSDRAAVPHSGDGASWLAAVPGRRWSAGAGQRGGGRHRGERAARVGSFAACHIQADDPAGISLVLRDHRIVRWGGPDRSSDKARVLAALLARPGTVFDVSDPDLVYAR